MKPTLWEAAKPALTALWDRVDSFFTSTNILFFILVLLLLFTSLFLRALWDHFSIRYHNRGKTLDEKQIQNDLKYKASGETGVSWGNLSRYQKKLQEERCAT